MTDTMTMPATRTYKLITDKKPVSWKLRTNRIFQNRVVEGKQIGLRQLVYVMGGHSIWREDYPKEIEPKFKSIWFESGILRVPKSDPLFIGYLESHPDFGTRFKLDDPEAEAKKELIAIERLDEVKSHLDKLEDYTALAMALTGVPSTVLQLTFSQKKLKCYRAATLSPEKVLKALADPKTDTTYLIILAFSRGVLAANPAKTDILWGDTREKLMPIPTGKKPIPAVVDYIVDQNGTDLYDQVVRKIKALEKEKVANKKPKTAAKAN